MMYCLAILLYVTHAQFWMGELKVVGNVDTPDSWVRNCLTVMSGKQFTLLELMTNQKRLEKTNNWASVRVSIESSETPNEYKTIIVSVQEKPWTWVYCSLYESALWLVFTDPHSFDYVRDRLRRHFNR
jgi:hypothetical protein